MKLSAGKTFPTIKLSKIGGGQMTLGVPQNGATWQMVLVYRGKHCPLCTKYLTKLKEMKQSFLDLGLDIVVISSDPLEKTQAYAVEELGLPFEIGYDMSIEQMKNLGLYISHPRNPEETDRPFAEPGIFVVNEEGKLHVVDISNNPFVRPDLDKLLSGIAFIKDPDNNYPIRGTFE